MSATINGLACKSLELTVPRYGAPWARAILADATAAPASGSRATLIAAGVAFSMTVTDSGARGGVYAVELTGGAAGWAAPAPVADGYRNAAGQLLSQVAQKLAERVGETIVVDSGVDRAIGTLVAVAGGADAPSAGVILSQLCALPEGKARVRWYVGPDGVTRLGERLPLGEVTATEVDAGERREWIAYAEEDASGLLPGATVDGRQIAELRIEAEPDSIREVCTLVDDGPAGSHTVGTRLLKWVLDIVRPLVLWRGVYTYRVTRVFTTTPGGSVPIHKIDAVPVTSKIAPQLRGLVLWPGAHGHTAKPKQGARCLVAFADANPNAPAIVGWMPADSGNGRPERADYDGETVALARGTLPCGRGGLSLTMGPISPTTAPGLALLFIDPDGNGHTWTVSGSNAAGPVAFTVAPGSGVDPSGEATLDDGRAEVLV